MLIFTSRLTQNHFFYSIYCSQIICKSNFSSRLEKYFAKEPLRTKDQLRLREKMNFFHFSQQRMPNTSKSDVLTNTKNSLLSLWRFLCVKAIEWSSFIFCFKSFCLVNEWSRLSTCQRHFLLIVFKILRILHVFYWNLV